MKKIISIAIVCILAISMCLPTFAKDETIIDITSEVKFATALDIYTNFLPVIRTDAQFLDPFSYVNGGDEGFTAPGTGTRTIFIDGIPFNNFFNDRFVIDISAKEEYAIFEYPALWANTYADGSTAKLVYNVDIPKDGIYEFVVVGCAQIKEDAVDNDAKDRGFCISIDGGQQKYQVNTSDTELTFREYSYTYTADEVKTTNITTTNGVNSQFFQVGYVYNITYELTKGTHSIEFWHLNYSGDTVMTKNGSRLNLMGIYVQEFLTETELALYKYPETVEQTETDAPETTKAATTTKADETTKAPETKADETTKAADDKVDEPAVTTAAPATSSGCSSSIGMGAVVIAAIVGSAWVARKKK